MKRSSATLMAAALIAVPVGFLKSPTQTLGTVGAISIAVVAIAVCFVGLMFWALDGE